MNLAFSTIEELRQKLEKKEISANELLTYFIERFQKYDKSLGSALEIFSKDSILEKYNPKGTLNAIPGLIKDNICQEGRITSCASKILENYNSTYDASTIKRLKEEGALLIGRANMDEFAMGSSNENSAYKKCANPWDLSRVPGGSSGGPGAAVAAGLIPWALGSETGGSVRSPAALCGIVGIKPTYGLVSRYGLVAYASSLDQIGVLTRTVKDNATVLSVIAGNDKKDSTSLPIGKKNYENFDAKLLNTIKIGVIKNALDIDGVDPEVKQAIENVIKTYEKLGIKIELIEIPSLDYTAAAYFIISRAEAASNSSRYDGVRYGYRDKLAKTLDKMYCKTRHDGFGQEVRLRILTGNYVLSAGHAGDYYQNAKKVQTIIRKDLHEVFNKVDLLIAPTQATPAFKFGTFDANRLQMDLQDYFTAFANLAGIPALSLPCGFSKNNLPIGFQLIGPHLSEELLYKVAYMYEQQMPWHTMHPKGF